MKFSKVLQASKEELPELNSMFLRYKELKKQLKSIPQREQSADPTRAASPAVSDLAEPHHDQDTEGKQGSQLSSEELRFINTLNEDLGKFNRFFMEQEEAAVIQLQALTDELDAQQGSATSLQLKERLVQFHGSCIMLMHWSLLNYAAVAKILKKHDKRTGLLLRAPCLSNVLQQPFNSTSVMSKLVKSAEEQLQKVTPQASTCKETSAHQQLQQQLQEQQRHVQHQHAQMQELPQHAAQHLTAHAPRGPQPQSPQPVVAPTSTGVVPSCFSGPACQVPLTAANEGATPSAAPSTAAGAGAGSGALSCGTSACTQLPGASGVGQEAGEGPLGAKSVSVSPQDSSLTSLTSQELQQQGGMGCQALRALEMWKTLQATASTPSTVVPEGQPVGCSAISQSQRTSEHGGAGGGDDSRRSCGKRSRAEEDGQDGQQSASYLVCSPNKRQSQEREVHA